MGDIFDGLENAEPRTSVHGDYIRPGVYEDLEVVGVRSDKNRSGESFFAIDFQVIKASGEVCNPAGSRCTWKCMAKYDGFKTDVRYAVAALFGVKFEEVNGLATRLVAFTKAQPAKGAHVRCEAWSKVTDKNKKDFTCVKFEHVSKAADWQERVTAAKAEWKERAAKIAAEAAAAGESDAF